MKYTGRKHSHSEEIEDYSEYLEKMKNRAITSMVLQVRNIKISSLKEPDKAFILSEMAGILNGGTVNEDKVCEDDVKECRHYLDGKCKYKHSCGHQKQT